MKLLRYGDDRGGGGGDRDGDGDRGGGEILWKKTRPKYPVWTNLLEIYAERLNGRPHCAAC